MGYSLRGLGRACIGGIVALTAFGAVGAGATEPSYSSMIVGDVTSQPIGHYRFCQRRPAECNVRSQPASAPRVTDFGWEVVDEINRAVNAAIYPRTDLEMHGVEEIWSYPEVEGDCEDYVLLKRLMLIERGFSPGDLLITVVRKQDGEGHAVLTVRTSQGDFILDNLNDDVLPWTETGYAYLKRQASFHSGRWVSIENAADVLVGALD